MTKEKKEEGAEAEAGKAGEKAPAKGDAKAAAAGRQKSRRQAGSQGREEEIIFAARSRFPRAWSICISSWAWEIRAGNTRRRATTRVFCWSKSWRRAGSGLDERNESSRRESPGPHATEESSVCEPQTFMNLSGETVGAVMDFYQLPLEEIVGGGGRRGFAVRRNPVASERQQRRTSWVGIHRAALASREFARCGSGLAAGTVSREITNYVLGRFDSAENELLEKVLDRAAEQVECWLDGGMEKAMSQFNGVVDSTNEKKK